MNEIKILLTNLEYNWTIVESIAVLFSIVYVVLAAKQNIWCWFFAAISVILYIYICFASQLFAETGLQFFYLIMAFYGYYNWNKPKSKLKIIQWSAYQHFLIILLGGVLTFLMGFYLTTYTSAKVPIIDSFTTIFSVIATYMITKKVLENWLYWIVIDIVAIYLYFNRDLQLSSLLFIIYTVIAIFGYFSWIKKIKTNV